LPADTIISNTKIIASQRLSEKRSKPPKANNMQDKTEDREPGQYTTKPSQLVELHPTLAADEPSSFDPPLSELQIPPNSPGM
jgi:hypothetical protein